jgi:ABC-type transporter Mla MlaB component
MAKDDTAPAGLFSRMVKFVRAPGTQWNDLDEASSVKEGTLSKQALKEMIERKRRNDFVRKREFDMLRKLRRREATGGGPSDGSARPSFFQSSMPSRPDDRAMTLKKIDEIEAQMSMQWWKTKHGTAGAASLSTTGSDFSSSEINARTGAPSAAAKSAATANSLAYARTAPDDLQNTLARSAAKFTPPEQQAPPGAARSLAGDSSANPQPVSPPVLTEQSVPASAQPQQSPDDLSLDFTADFAPASKAVIKTTPFSTQSATPVASAPATAPLAVPASAPKAPVAPAASIEAKAPATIEAFKPAKAPTQSKPGLLGGLAASYDGSGATSGFTASKLFAVEVDEVQHDPELEEAAIRFANGDDSGAEAGLLEAISARGPRHQHEETWLTLFDLYRATAQYDRFESLAIDFASKFHRSSPMWFSIPEMVGKLAGAEPVAAQILGKSDWKCPANFGIQTLAALNAALSKAPMPWTMDWGNLQMVEEAAVAPLTKLLLGWAQQSVQLRFAGAQKLEEVLRLATPSGDRSVSHDRWNLLMAYLRVAHRPDEFELAALDFCVTYEVSPPSWESARCEFKTLDADGNTGLGQTIIGDAVHDSIVSEMQSEPGTIASMMTAQLASVEMSGQIMGEPKPVLDKLEARLTGADVMIISCAKLIRVDFSAAGSLLNWVTARQAEGRIVQFSDVHRLVAAFFHVIGISEHAKVSTRVD